ncbi:AbrB/MazE/SpoVT family DNA-binding domain-containing protein [Comamonas flocculans]|uniref:AbrB/MazE/SpoVT family DNA-binding domain-containing protein n=1 Tax=Comamonas flocculans TaxID=2597701 RepID=A0A5B8RQB0_9BURK|nr:AbrB/MazE/SpoVT family DNA-binding domain-containing protein [Comamonas flocculans]QEA11800.1 AbrB/MazE/SpoVT family DNA-binding domain-containing protein [Comamonas flocculans]
MTEVLLDIKYWGNSLGVRLPAKVARAARLNAEQRVRMLVENGRVVIEPVRDAQPTLGERLARFDAQRHGGEAMPDAGRLGAEQW